MKSIFVFFILVFCSCSNKALYGKRYSYQGDFNGAYSYLFKFPNLVEIGDPRKIEKFVHGDGNGRFKISGNKVFIYYRGDWFIDRDTLIIDSLDKNCLICVRDSFKFCKIVE